MSDEKPAQTKPSKPPASLAKRFVCEQCWAEFSDDTHAQCPACKTPCPSGGWAGMPYLFRDRYRFLKCLGRGGMGAVFLAHVDRASHGDGLDTSVAMDMLAIKVVRRVGDPAQQRMFAKLFRHESRAAGMLSSSKHFVKVVGHDEQSPMYLAMEYVPWPTMDQLLQKGLLSPRQTAQLGVALLRALGRMHSFNMVHRDLKPGNVFVNEIKGDYMVKIADLGLWTVGQDDPTKATSMASPDGGAVVGTLSYQSPEQMRRMPVGPRSDLHAVGSILWQMATGSVPFPGVGANPNERLADRAERVMKPLERPPFLPEGLFKVLKKALALGPEKRHQTADAFADELTAFLATPEGAEPVKTTTGGNPVPKERPPFPPAASTEEKKEEPKKAEAKDEKSSEKPAPSGENKQTEEAPKGNGRVIAGVVLLLLLAAVAVGLASTQQSNPPSTPRNAQSN